MPNLLTVFLGSPADVSYARSIAKEVFDQLNQEIQGQLFFLCRDYRDLPGGVGSPQQDKIDWYLEESALILLFFGRKVGKGTISEYQLGFELFRNGKLIDMMIYCESDNTNAEMAELKRSIGEDNLFHEFRDQGDLKTQLLQHIRLWVQPKIRLFEVLDAGIPQADLIEAMAVHDIVYTDDLIALSQKKEEEILPKGQRLLQQYLSTNDATTRWSAAEFFMVARCLYKEILAQNAGLFSHKPFQNPFHQFLSNLIRHSDKREVFISILSTWLLSTDTIPNTTRDFAAFELGMIRAAVAVPALVRAIRNQNELPLVRYYSVLAIGMIKDKSATDALLRQYVIEPKTAIRNAIYNALYFIYKK
jgi:hypothetical protein